MVLNGDRLYKIQLPAEYLLAVVSFLCVGLWLINLGIQRFLIFPYKRIHPLILQFILSVLGLSLLAILSVQLTTVILGPPFVFDVKNLTLTSAFLFRVNLFLNTINAVVYFNAKYKEKELETEKMRVASLNARYEVLNNQINPHFLFNSLNTLSSLLKSDTDKAEEFLQKLAETYRYVLKNRDNELVSLHDELAFIACYSELLTIRFQNALHIKIEVTAEQQNYFVPPTVLQLLIENVVKHNIFTEKQPVNVVIQSVGDGIKITNTLIPKTSKEYSTGIGLRNIAERYQFFNKKIKVEQTSESFTVSLPLIMIN
jgi:LytS/YehU family sensor histidine kinase